MTTRKRPIVRKPSWRRRLLIAGYAFMLLAFILYTFLQLLNGDRGVSTWLKLKTQVSEIKSDNAALEGRKKELEIQVQRLNPDGYDPDFTEELIRKKLPYAKEDDYVLFIKPLSKTQP